VQQQPLQNQSKSNSLPYNLNNNSQNVGRTHIFYILCPIHII
jgi:hypothetical protein